ncbi:MAG: hypothetical protein B5766_11450 [Candidatus Lumbricidophila eiseniae]|uniref:Uncharacterized protein n=1 Tax=Candidatus Lumbricidiphila eiseniae TaxID=1969409 RepID=A0A2A6FNU6_9MICO|nr:MAG: hypothetical protein B5766_11450 [Candidatus Lumbricidophila eiseniae]
MGTTGCSAQQNVPPVEPSSEIFTELISAPNIVPSVTIDGTVIALSQLNWITDDKPVHLNFTDLTLVPITPLPASGTSLTIVISSDIPPEVLDIGLYSKLDAGGLPDSSDGGTNINCLDSDQCVLTYSPGSLQVRVSVGAHHRIGVVRCGYLKAMATVDKPLAPELVTAAWVFRLTDVE